MFVRMSYWKCLQSCWGEDIKLFESGAVKIMQQHDGFVRAMLLAISGESQRIAFTTWDTPEDYAKFVKSPDLQKIIEMFEHMYEEGGAPSPIEYEVRAQG